MSETENNLDRFMKRFKIESYPCMKFENANISPVLTTPKLNLECFELNCQFKTIKFYLNVVATEYEGSRSISKLQIKLENQVFRNEFAPCINYLQRKKDLELAFLILYNYDNMVYDRLVIFDQILFTHRDSIEIKESEEGGFSIICGPPNKDFKYFQAGWAVGWNYRSLDVFDNIDFLLNTEDVTFYNNVKDTFKKLTLPHNDLNTKVEYWCYVMNLVKKSDFVLKNSIQDISLGMSCVKITDESNKNDTIEISDDDNETDIVISDESSEDEIEVVTAENMDTT